MANCENCGHTISDERAVCPECGYVKQHVGSTSTPDLAKTALGFFLAFISPFIFGIGLIVIWIWPEIRSGMKLER